MSVSTFAYEIRTCDDLSRARLLHGTVSSSHHLRSNRFLSNLIIQMYGRCGQVEDARHVFNKLRTKNLFSWNLMLQAYVGNGKRGDASLLFKAMDLDGVQPDVCTFLTALASCRCLTDGVVLSVRISATGLDVHNVVVGTALIKMFGDFGQPEMAKRVFDSMQRKNDVTSATMLVAYTQRGHIDQARRFFESMEEPSLVAWTGMLAAYGRRGDVSEAKSLFEKMPSRDVITWTTLLTVLAQNGHRQDAKQLFDRMPERTVVTWNAMLSAYGESGELGHAKSLFDLLPNRDETSWFLLFEAYATYGELGDVRVVFEQLPRQTAEAWSSFITALARHGKMQEARSVFESLPTRNSGNWSSIIAGYARNGDLTSSRALLLQMPDCDSSCYCANTLITAHVKAGKRKEAVLLFRELNLQGVSSLQSVLAAVFDACSPSEAQVFLDSALEAGLRVDVVARNALINVLGKSGLIREAKTVFDGIPDVERDAVTWNTMLAAYVQDRKLDAARCMFDSMPSPNTVAWTSMLSAYTHAGHIDQAKTIFDGMPERNVVSWNAMIVGYTQNGLPREAYRLFQAMDIEGVQADRFSLVAALDACVGIPAVVEGKLLHAEAVARGLETEVTVGNTLINFYGKCGQPRQARSVFHRLPEKDVITWTSIITAYAQNGYMCEPLELIRLMTLEGIQPNHVTVVSILSACSHAGSEGWYYFMSLQADYGIQPQPEHFSCMIDHLSRGGWCLGAKELMKSMPYVPNEVAMTTAEALLL